MLGDNPVLRHECQRLSKAWDDVAASFSVTIPKDKARKMVSEYAAQVGVPAQPALDSIDRDIIFPALSLDFEGRPVRVLNSDVGFRLAFTQPEEREVLELLSAIMRPFPAGLLTPVGFVIANPVFLENQAQREAFGRNAYHGSVIWSWQQALLATGIHHQLSRADLSVSTQSSLKQVEKTVWSIINAHQNSQAAELWTWDYRDGKYEAVPFGQGHGDADESNAAQLWSTVYLGMQAPQ
jgi:hypothetical protein